MIIKHHKITQRGYALWEAAPAPALKQVGISWDLQGDLRKLTPQRFNYWHKGDGSSACIEEIPRRSLMMATDAALAEYVGPNDSSRKKLVEQATKCREHGQKSWLTQWVLYAAERIERPSTLHTSDIASCTGLLEVLDRLALDWTPLLDQLWTVCRGSCPPPYEPFTTILENDDALRLKKALIGLPDSTRSYMKDIFQCKSIEADDIVKTLSTVEFNGRVLGQCRLLFTTMRKAKDSKAPQVCYRLLCALAPQLPDAADSIAFVAGPLQGDARIAKIDRRDMDVWLDPDYDGRFLGTSAFDMTSGSGVNGAAADIYAMLHTLTGQDQRTLKGQLRRWREDYFQSHEIVGRTRDEEYLLPAPPYFIFNTERAQHELDEVMQSVPGARIVVVADDESISEEQKNLEEDLLAFLDALHGVDGYELPTESRSIQWLRND